MKLIKRKIRRRRRKTKRRRRRRKRRRRRRDRGKMREQKFGIRDKHINNPKLLFATKELSQPDALQ